MKKATDPQNQNIVGGGMKLCFTFKTKITLVILQIYIYIYIYIHTQRQRERRDKVTLRVTLKVIPHHHHSFILSLK